MLTGKKVLIFDLGGVVIDLFVDRTFAAMVALGVPAEMLTEQGCLMNARMMQYDRGDITTDEMFAYIKSFIPQSVADKLGAGLDAEVQRVWNLMLGDIPAAKLQFLAALRGAGYRVVMLSNTNSGHWPRIEQLFAQAAGKSPAECFDALYLSYLMRRRNPNPRFSSHSLRAREWSLATASSSTIRPRTVLPHVLLALMLCMLSAMHRGMGYSMNDYADNN